MKKIYFISSFLLLAGLVLGSDDCKNPTIAAAKVKLTSSAPYPEGVPSEKTVFSIGDGKKVYFSMGNLWYHIQNNYKRKCAGDVEKTGGYFLFADEQFKMKGILQRSLQNGDELDLFCYGTSGNTLDPTSYNLSNGDSYSANKCLSYSINGTNDDWGVFNPITNGGNKPGMWRTLTNDEWTYLIANHKHGCGQVSCWNQWYWSYVVSYNYAYGMIILPDNWECPEGCSFTENADFDDNNVVNTYSYDQWKAMEAAGAVFLPAVSSRRYDSQDPPYQRSHNDGTYWTSTYLNGVYNPSTWQTTWYQYYVGFNNSTLSTYNSVNSSNRWDKAGRAVRLVTDLPASSGSFYIEAEPYNGKSTVTAVATDATHATLTPVAATGYTFWKWSDGNTDNPRTVEKTDNDDNFVALFKHSGLDSNDGNVEVELQTGEDGFDINDLTTYKFNFSAIPNTDREGHGCDAFQMWSDGDQTNPRIYELAMDCEMLPNFYSKTMHSDVTEKGSGAVYIKNGQCEVTLTAVPDNGYIFYQWSDECENRNSATRIVDCATGSYSAEFIPDNLIKFNLGDHATYSGGTIPDAHGYALEPEGVTPAEMYEFMGWENENHELVSFPYFCAGTLTAKCEEITYAVRLNSDPYNSLAEALEVIQDGDVLEFVKDLEENLVVPAISITVKGNDKTLTGDIAIANGGSIDLQSELTATNLYLASQAGSSSQILNADKLTISGSAYIDITLEPNAATASSSRWYAIAVPFDVNTENGVFDTNNQLQVCETNVRFAKWNGEARAISGTGFQYPYCGTLEAGKLYMMTINGNNNVWRFKSNGTFTETTHLDLVAYGDVNTPIENKGWNAISNPTLSYAKVNEASGYAYLYHSETNDYTAQELADCSFVMGSPFVVQVATDKTITFTPDATGMLHAPMQGNEDAIRYVVSMTDGKTTDYLYLTAHEDAIDQYVIGRDLGKMRSNVPQLWTTAYNDVALAAQDALLTESEIIYALTMSAPQTTTVTLSANYQENADLYLMQGGYPVCQLSEMPYEVKLIKGLTTDYYFIVSPKAPQAPTDCTILKNGVQAIKFMIGGEMYIQINGKIYNVLGGKVK